MPLRIGEIFAGYRVLRLELTPLPGELRLAVAAPAGALLLVAHVGLLVGFSAPVPQARYANLYAACSPVGCCARRLSALPGCDRKENERFRGCSIGEALLSP